MGYAIVELGWTAAQFWTATPHEMAAAAEYSEARADALREAHRR